MWLGNFVGREATEYKQRTTFNSAQNIEHELYTNWRNSIPPGVLSIPFMLCNVYTDNSKLFYPSDNKRKVLRIDKK